MFDGKVLKREFLMSLAEMASPEKASGATTTERREAGDAEKKDIQKKKTASYVGDVKNLSKKKAYGENVGLKKSEVRKEKLFRESRNYCGKKKFRKKMFCEQIREKAEKRGTSYQAGAFTRGIFETPPLWKEPARGAD